MHLLATAILPLLALLTVANAQNCELVGSIGVYTLSCTDSNGGSISQVTSITLNGVALPSNALPQSIAVSDLLEGVNVLVVLIPVSGGDATLRIDFNYEPVYSCSSEAIDGTGIRISCTRDGVDLSGRSVSYNIRAAGSQSSTGSGTGTLPLTLALSEFGGPGGYSVSLTLQDDDGQFTITLPPTTVTISTEAMSVGCDVQLTADHVEVTCTLNGAIFTGDATYTINPDSNTPSGPTDIDAFPVIIPLSEFQGGDNVLLITLELEPGVSRDFSSLVTIGQSQIQCGSSSSSENGVQITCTGGSVGSYMYSLNGGSFQSGTGPVDIAISLSELIANGPNVVVLRLFGLTGALLGETSINIGTIFSVTCSLGTNPSDLSRLITCTEITGSESIASYQYVIVNEDGVIISSSMGTTFPIILATLTGNNLVRLTLTSFNGLTNTVDISLTQEQSFVIECSVVQTMDNTIVLECETTGSNSQTIESVDYFINDQPQTPVVVGGLHAVTITIPTSNPDIMEGANNAFRLVFTGSEGAEGNLAFNLDVEGPADIPPQCSISVNSTHISITCSAGSMSIASYTVTINGVEYTSMTGNFQELAINLGIFLQQLQNGSNSVVVTLYSDTAGTVMLLRRTFTVSITRPVSSFEVSCIGTYMASGGYLQVECTSAPDGQDISALEYYVNGNFQGPELLTFMVNVSLLDRINNSVEILVTGSEGTELTLTLFFIQVPCSFSVINGEIRIYCLSGGLDIQTTYSYEIIINGQVNSALIGFLDVGEPIVIGTSNPDLFSSGENEILLILRGEDGSVVTRQMLTITAIECLYTIDNDGVNITCTGDLNGFYLYELIINNGLPTTGNQFPILISPDDSRFYRPGPNTISLTLFRTDGTVLNEVEVSFLLPVSCSYLVVDGEISISCLSGGSEFQATYEVVINGEVSSTLTGSIGVGTPIIIDTANPDLLSTIVNEIMFILRGSDGSIITQQTLTITSVSCSYLVLNGEISISCLSGDAEVEATYEVIINGEVATALTGSTGVGTPIIIDTANPDLFSTGVNEIMFILRGSDGSIITQQMLTVTSVSCSYLVVDGEISISCLSGGSEVEAMYEVIINGEVATALTGSTGMGTPIIIDTANPDLLSTGVNEIMFILRGSDGSIITQQMLTVTSVSCLYLVVDGEISISCLSGGSEVEAMYEVIINGEVATALTGSTGMGTPITIDTANPDLLSTGVNEIMFILRGSDGSIITQQMLTISIVQCSYILLNDEIQIICTGNLEDFDHYELVINTAPPTTGNQFPIFINTDDSRLVSPGINTFILTLFRADDTVISEVQLDISFTPTLELICEEAAFPGRASFTCTATNTLVETLCFFDGSNVPETCSFPIEVNSTRFGFTQHTLRVIATDEFGQTAVIDFSFQLAEPLQPIEVPSAPLNLMITERTQDAIEVSWSPPASNGSSDIVGYFLEVSGGNTGIELEVGVDVLSYRFTGLDDETAYTIFVSANNSEGRGAPAVASVTTFPNLELTCGQSAVPGRASFSCDSTNTLVETLCFFDGSNVPETCSFPIEVNSARFGFTQHTLRVIATDEFGQTAVIDFSFQLAEPLPPREAPSVPLNFAVSDVTPFSIQVSWSPPASNGSSDIVSYFLELSGAFSIEVDVGADVLSYTFTGLTESTTYNVSVLAINNEGRGTPAVLEVTTLRGILSLGFGTMFSISEGAPGSLLRFGMTGTSEDAVSFSLVPLTYQQFEAITGQQVANIFSSVPSPASEDDISPSGRLDTNFGPVDQLVAADYIYDVSSAVVDDAELEGDEGFILYFDFSDSSNNPSDLARLEAGNRAILVTILDDDAPVEPLDIECSVVIDTLFALVDCTRTGGFGLITYTCTYDSQPSESCFPSPLFINLLDYDVGEHTLLIEVTDSRGTIDTFLYTFEVQIPPPDLILIVSPSYITVSEDGSGESVAITKIGYSFGQVDFYLRPLIYSEYESLSVGASLDTVFPLRPPTGATFFDFDGTVLRYSFPPGLIPPPPFIYDTTGIATLDTVPEFTEGFLLYLAINESSLHPRDLARLQSGSIRIINQLVLVSITNNDLALTCTATGDVLVSVSVECSGNLPPGVPSTSVMCYYSGNLVDCSSFPVVIATGVVGSGSYTVMILGTITATGEPIAVGETTFAIPEIDLYFINDSPLLVGGSVYAEFEADRDGLLYYCHLTHFHPADFREDCSSGVYNVSGIPPGDYTLRVIAYDPLRGEDRAVIRNRLWVHSSDPIDQYCIMYLKNRGWGVSGNTFSVDFTGTGAASGPNAEFECSVDRQPHEPCTSPLVVTLPPGQHHVRVRPTGCGRDYRVWNKRFTIP